MYILWRKIKFISHSYFSWSLFFISSASLSFIWVSWSSLNRVVTWRFKASTSLPTCRTGNPKHNLHQRLEALLCGETVWTISVQLRLVIGLNFWQWMPHISCIKKKFWIQLFPHRVLIDQLGCTCDNNFAIIKINSDHSSEDHRSQITVVSNLSS